MTGDVPGYVLRHVLGEGTRATVWRAEIEGHPGRIVAVKRLRGPVSSDAIADLRREAAALERLSHPSILRLLDVVEDGEGVALVVPFAPGGTLAARIAAGDPTLTPTVVADLGARLGSALAAAHNAGLVHRDVKPANILFDAEGQPLLADFGTARLLGEDRVATAGTAEYLDPEVLSAPAGTSSDVYGLGATLFEALAGTPPYAGSTPEATLRAAGRGRHVPLGALSDASPALAAAVERAIARDPAARPATAARFAGELDDARRELEATDGVHVASGPPPPAVTDTGAPPGSGRDVDPTGGPTPRPATAPPADERSGTRLFGPAPPRAAEASPSPKRRIDRRLLLGAAVLALLVPVGVVSWLLADGAADGGADPAPIGAADPQPGPQGPLERTPPPRCEGVAPPPGASASDLIDADVDARGCSVPVAWDGDVLRVPRAEDAPRVYDLDAEVGDQLLFGDWTCDGGDTPALYRAATGELFLFDGFAERDEEVTGRVEETGVADGHPRVLTDDAGCDRVEVEAR